MSTLALVMIVKDEQDNLERCLDSIVGAVDEIVVVDTCSTDGTVALAQSYGDKVPGGLKVLPFEWSDDFSAVRNYGLENADSDWALGLDMDLEYKNRIHQGIKVGERNRKKVTRLTISHFVMDWAVGQGWCRG